ncbi:MAG: aminotransferase class I/II-fold pyridoxal phosphate-dependent enzyme [Candidatus Brocadiales bacterium]|nr:aminotransferase class I/II-fold pyridoxal phosphate-dependent enzyme [Candidatus Brocadiales bacterium]
MENFNPQAVELNENIQRDNANVLNMLSVRGKGIFFPKKGILGQSAEAKGKEINATIGIALEEDGSPLRLGCIDDLIDVEPAAAFPYAPSFGRPDLRSNWKAMIYEKNPSLQGTEISSPVVTCALTHGLSMSAYLFGDEGDQLISPDLYWGNYRLIFGNTYSVGIETYETFEGDGFNVSGLRDVLLGSPAKKCLVSLNFPNNPTGYTPTISEVARIRDVLVEAADGGRDIVALIDDAYFGLVYEDGITRESIFAALANAHERLLAVKIDGATKEDYVWGFRVGFITYAIKGGSKSVYEALEAKTAGAIRGTISNSSNLSQSLLNAAYKDENYNQQKREKYQTLQRRYTKVKEILSTHPEYEECFTALPFNSGYFMCLKPVTVDPENVRQILLSDYSTGIIVASGVMRLAFSSTPFDLLEKLFDNIFQACQKAKA